MAERSAKHVGAVEPLLELENFQVGFARGQAVRGIDLTINRGEALGIVGESGSGKSVTWLAALGLLGEGARISGRAELEGRDLLGMSEKQLAKLRGGKIALIFQDPMSALNPVKKVGRQVEEVLNLHRAMKGAAARAEVVRLFDQVGIPNASRRVNLYPHELSGGQNQRVMIAMALAGQPDLLIADEPTTALDVTIQAQILSLLEMLRRDLGMALVLISHDLSVVGETCERIAVVYAGRIVETGSVAQILNAPSHPYTRGLINAAPRLGTSHASLQPIPGHVPEPWNMPPGCAFAPRCPLTSVDCDLGQPLLAAVSSNGHRSACLRWDEIPATRAFPPVLSRRRMPLLELRDVRREYRASNGFFRKPASVRAVDGVSIKVESGRTLGLVGESGCGKSTTGRMALGLEEPTGGEVLFDGEPMPPANSSEWRALRRRAQLIFQDPLGALDRRMKVRDQIIEPLTIHRIGTPEFRAQRADELLRQVGLRPDQGQSLPLRLSGGQRQRVVIARALAMKPELIVCDEPVSALDVSIQAQVMTILTDLQRQLGLAMVFISHDLKLVASIADEIAIMYLGKIVEQGSPSTIFSNPGHPYTQVLIGSIPQPMRTTPRPVLAGEPPDPSQRPFGCGFHPRCPIATELCRQQDPQLASNGAGHQIACHFPFEAAIVSGAMAPIRQFK